MGVRKYVCIILWKFKGKKYLRNNRKGLSRTDNYKNADNPLYKRLCFILVKEEGKNKSESCSCEVELVNDNQGKCIKSNN